MSASLIDSNSYSDLSAGSFNAYYMSRLSTTSSDYDDLGELENLISETPVGLDDTTQMPPARKFIGKELSSSTPTTVEGGPILYYWCCYDTYFFWIHTGNYCVASISPCSN